MRCAGTEEENTGWISFMPENIIFLLEKKLM